MEIKNVNCKSLEELENAVSQWTVGEPHPMLDIINQVQQESFLEGYNHAIESLQEQLEPSSPKAFIQLNSGKFLCQNVMKHYYYFWA